jgi:long-chain acyl-CoA synthetase
MTPGNLDTIHENQANTLPKLVAERIRRSPEKLAFRYFHKIQQQWLDYNWREFDEQICLWQAAMRDSGLQAGQTAGIMICNCPEWVIFEQAAMRLGAILVPLYPNDRPDNVAHIINEAEVQLLLIDNGLQYDVLLQAAAELNAPPKVISLERIPADDKIPLTQVDDWIRTDHKADHDDLYPSKADDLTTIVYTSGTTGLPKGVMLSHRNILFNARAGIAAEAVYADDLFLSFLPLSHTLERTVGLYIPILTGASIAFSRSIPHLAEDLVTIKPTVIITVPRIFERVYSKVLTQLAAKPPIAKKLFDSAVNVGWRRFEHRQGRASFHPKQLLWPLLDKLVAEKIMAKLGGRLRFAISGGAPLPETIGKTFIGLGLPILQGYGLTEASPVVSVNPSKRNLPSSIGPALPGIQVRIADDGELQTLSPSVMLGYWKNEQATKDTMTDDGWLKTGDLARIDNKYIYITGRKKEIMVLSNGEKVPPVDIEMAITLDPLFEQAMVIGEQRPYLTAVVVLEPAQWEILASELNISADAVTDAKVSEHVIKRISKCMCQFPGYAQIRRVHISLHTWTDGNGLLTASLKMRRKELMAYYNSEIESLYDK